jgi:hypothetical protein
VQKFAGMHIKFCYCEISIASNERISVGIRSEFNVFIDHGFA